MTPKEFMDKWGMTAAELGVLTGYKEDTVYRWETRGYAPPKVLQWIEACDFMLTLQDSIPQHFQEIYKMIRDRRSE